MTDVDGYFETIYVIPASLRTTPEPMWYIKGRPSSIVAKRERKAYRSSEFAKKTDLPKGAICLCRVRWDASGTVILTKPSRLLNWDQKKCLHTSIQRITESIATESSAATASNELDSVSSGSRSSTPPRPRPKASKNKVKPYTPIFHDRQGAGGKQSAKFRSANFRDQSDDDPSDLEDNPESMADTLREISATPTTAVPAVFAQSAPLPNKGRGRGTKESEVTSFGITIPRADVVETKIESPKQVIQSKPATAEVVPELPLPTVLKDEASKAVKDRKSHNQIVMGKSVVSIARADVGETISTVTAKPKKVAAKRVREDPSAPSFEEPSLAANFKDAQVTDTLSLKRGRKPKYKGPGRQKNSSATLVLETEIHEVITKAKRGRGRPRNPWVPPTDTPKRPRGRPRNDSDV